MKAVANTTPLIYLAKTNLLEILKKMFDEVYISKEVYKEAVVQGMVKGYQDAHIIDKACKSWIKSQKIKSDLVLWLTGRMPNDRLEEIISKLTPLSDEDISTITLAVELKVDRLILDDRAAIVVGKLIAEYCEFKVIGTGNIINDGFAKNYISREDWDRFKSVVGESAALE